MCVLNVRSNTESFKGFVNNTKIHILSSHEKGDKRHKTRKYPPYEDYGFSCKISEKEWTDLEKQIQDALDFLTKHEKELTNLINSYAIDDIRLHFPYYCRLSKQNNLQFNYFPAELLLKAGKLNIGIELSQYPKPEKTLVDKISEKFKPTKENK